MITISTQYSLRELKVHITAVIILLVCNRHSYYSHGQNLYTHFRPQPIIALTITRAITGHILIQVRVPNH